MHEIAIAESVVRIALDHAQGRRITRLKLTSGHLLNVVPATLTFAVQMAAQGTRMEGAELAIVTVPGTGRCRDCTTETTLARFPFVCPACGSFAVDVTAGEELRVE